MIIGEYSPRRSRGEYSPKITEPEANNCFSIFTQVNLQNNWPFIKFYYFCWRKKTKMAFRQFVNLFLLLYSPVSEYKECHVKFYQSQRRISYIHLCKNTKLNYNIYLFGRLAVLLRVSRFKVIVSCLAISTLPVMLYNIIYIYIILFLKYTVLAA